MVFKSTGFFFNTLYIIKEEVNYTDIFENNINENIAKTVEKIVSLREELLEETQQKSPKRPTLHKNCAARRFTISNPVVESSKLVD